jgi:hypothetical protein
MEHPTSLLRRTLLANACFSLLTGTTLVLAFGALAEAFAVPDSRIVLIVGLSLLPFGARLLMLATQEVINLAEAKLAVALDLGWVLGSAAVLAMGVLSTTGNWTVAMVADLVLAFGVLQHVGVRRIQTTRAQPA